MRVCARCNTPVGNGSVCPKCGSTSFAFANDFGGSDDTVILDTGAPPMRPQTPPVTQQRQPQPVRQSRPVQPAAPAPQPRPVQQPRPAQAPPMQQPTPVQPQQQTPVPMQAVPAAAGAYAQQYPNNNKKNTGLIIGIAAGAGAILLIVLIVIIALAARSTPEKTVRQFEKAFNSKNVSQMMDTLNYDMRSYTDYEDLVEFIYEDNYTMDINITGKYSSGYNEYTVYGTISLTNGFESENGTCEFTLVKQGGDWKIDDLDFDSYDYDYYSYDPYDDYGNSYSTEYSYL